MARLSGYRPELLSSDKKIILFHHAIYFLMIDLLALTMQLLCHSSIAVFCKLKGDLLHNFQGFAVCIWLGLLLFQFVECLLTNIKSHAGFLFRKSCCFYHFIYCLLLSSSALNSLKCSVLFFKRSIST